MKLLQGPKTPAFWQLAQWILDPVSYMEAATRQYGDIFSVKLSLGMGTFIFVSSPWALQQILTNDRKQFAAPGEANRIVASLLGDYSVILLSGEAHKKRRQLLLPPFHGERMRSYGDTIRDLTVKVMDELPKNQPFEARSATQLIALQVIMETVFGISQGERYQTLKKLLSEMLNVFRSPVMASLIFFPILQQNWGSWSPWGRYMRSQRQIDELLFAEIAEHKQNPDPNRTDILSLLLSARDESGNPMSDQELRDELITLLFAGHETTATAMSWALYWTHRYPEIKAKILQELATLGDNPNPIEIARLPYLAAVCSETLRIYPVGILTFPRIAQEPVELDGYSLPEKSILMGCIYLAHHREEVFPDSHRFNPDRFLEKQFTPYEFMPFGGGARRCIGEALALFEMRIAVATILSGYELSLVDKAEEKPTRRGLTLAPSRGVRMRLEGQRQRLESSPSSPRFPEKLDTQRLFFVNTLGLIMPLIRIAKPWEISENEITPESLYVNRRHFLKGLIGAGIAGGSYFLTGCDNSSSRITVEDSVNLPKIDKFTPNPAFLKVDRPITNEDLAARYNNFYEFGGGKNIWLKAQKLPIQPWQVEVSGLVKNSRTYDIDEIKKTFPLEERIYRFRCVEAWSMVLPWIGFPMRALMEAVEPTSEAKFVRFTSFYDPDITKGPGLHFGELPWPYTEGLRIEEMANDLAFFAVGLYGHDLPRQHGAPIRMVMPWKYGFKGAKSIVKVEFLATQPATYWNTLGPNEYGFEANVNPSKPHPRWSQATERFIGNGTDLSWEMKETLPYNGYGEYVASLYS